MSSASSLVSAAPLALACLTLSFLSPQPLVGDYTNVPADPRAMEKRLMDAKLSLSQAIEVACKETGGRASSAEMIFDREKTIAHVMTYGEGKGWRCMVDAETGAVKKIEIPPFTWPGDPVTGEWITTPSGLRYTDLRVGDGAKPSGAWSTVKVHYTVWLLDGTQVDTSVGKEPLVRALNSVITGWTEGIGSMQVGGKRKMCVPFKLGYGELGRGQQIPPRATLIFDVELLEIVKP
jgi:peptidylprolyl isomerase